MIGRSLVLLDNDGSGEYLREESAAEPAAGPDPLTTTELQSALATGSPTGSTISGAARTTANDSLSPPTCGGRRRPASHRTRPLGRGRQRYPVPASTTMPARGTRKHWPTGARSAAQKTWSLYRDHHPGADYLRWPILRRVHRPGTRLSRAPPWDRPARHSHDVVPEYQTSTKGRLLDTGDGKHGRPAIDRGFTCSTRHRIMNIGPGRRRGSVRRGCRHGRRDGQVLRSYARRSTKN